MRIEPRALVRRLTPTATRALEACVGRAANAQAYEIVPEHLLALLLEAEQGDVPLFLRQFSLDRAALAARVDRSLSELRGGNAGRPVFSRALFSWIEDAWLVASVERSAPLARTGDLLAAFAENHERYTAQTFPELEALAHHEIRKTLDEITADSAEAQELPKLASAGARPSGSAQGGAPQVALARFTVSFTQLARDGKIDPVLGRHMEIRQMIDVLSRRRKNNPILVGEPGVGKTALVEGLARAIVMGDVPDSLRDVELVGLDLGALQAGSGVRGEFEQRLKSVIQEIKSAPKPVILFIDEAHTLIGAGGAQGTGDAANLLKPELARGELRTVAATTFAEYKKYFEKDAALERRFQPIKIEEPTEAEAITILRGLRETYEKAHGISIRDEALVAAAKLSHRYISGRKLPDKAVDLLDSTAARAKTEARAKPEALVALEANIASAERQKAALERDRADGLTIDTDALDAAGRELTESRGNLSVLHERWERERAAVEALFGARAALAQAEGNTQREALSKAVESASEALKAVQGDEPLLHVQADAHAVARVVQGWTGIPVGKMHSDNLRSVLDLEQHLTARIKGQETAVRVVADSVRMASAGVAPPEAPRAVLLFVGTSGVGKTEAALALADIVYGGERFLTSINMSEYQEKHSVSRLVGSPPGYVGYGEGGVLTEAVRRHPYSVVLLDECEKADLEVMNLFYQVFDKGVLSDGEGRRVDFRNTIVILTSNLATDIISSLHRDGARPDANTIREAIRPTLSKHFKPALLARMTVVPFSPMSPDILRDIVELKLERLRAQIAATHRAETVFSPQLIDELTRRCTESESGARNIDHVLRGSLLPALSRKVLERMADEATFRHLHVDTTHEGWSISLS